MTNAGSSLSPGACYRPGQSHDASNDELCMVEEMFLYEYATIGDVNGYGLASRLRLTIPIYEAQA